MKKLLWIDDDERLVDASIPVFMKYGFYISKATNTSRALKILREEHIDGILLDVQLHGGESGLELLEEVLHLYPTLKIAIFTGYPEYDDHVRALHTGASVYLGKVDKSIPLDPDKQRRFFDALHQVFPARPTSLPSSAASTTFDLEALRRTIAEHFDVEEFRTFCFDLGIDYDSLRGEGKDAKVRELVAYMARQGCLEDLIAAVRKARPNVTEGFG